MVTTSRFYVPELDGLRFFAFLMVFIHHVLPGTDAPDRRVAGSLEAARWVDALAHAGQFGVDIFFVLSAYLITELLVREHDRLGSIHVREFYARRCLRIWPLYFAFLGTMTVFHVVRGHPELLRVAGWFAVFAGNWECAFHGFPMSAISPLWTVSIEEQFYLFWPIALSLVMPRRIPTVVVGMLAAATVARVVVAYLALPHPATWCITFTRLDPIALGILAVPLSRRFEGPCGPRPRWAAIVCGATLLVLVTRFGTIREGYGCLVSYPVAAIGAFLPVAALVPRGEGPCRLGALRWPPFVFLGRISYGLYVLHTLAIAFAAHVLDRLGSGSAAALFVLALGVDIAVAAASYALLEKPFLRLKTRFTLVESRPGG